MSAESSPPETDQFRARLEAVLSDQYELDREVGRGGMGIVYRAVDRRLKRAVALKLLPPELAFRADVKSRFLREAVSAAQLSHPNIVPIFSVDEREGLVYFAMGYVDGENLGQLVARRGAIPPEEVRDILRQVADALAYAHSNGVVHRDIKPDNIIMDAHSSRPMVTDFGIARALTSPGETRLTATGVAIGTPAYMSPEQCAGDRDVDGRSDLYSLGTVAYQLLAGSPPFEASTTPAMLIKQFSEKPVELRERRPDVPSDLAEIVMRLLEKKPEDRFATGSDLVDALSGRLALAPRSLAAPAPRQPEAAAAGTATAGRRPADVQEGMDSGERETGRRSRKKLKFKDRPLPERVKITRDETFRALFMALFFFVINMVTSPEFPWFIFPALGIGMGAWEKMANLWSEGLRATDVFGKNATRVLAGGPPSRMLEASGGSGRSDGRSDAERYAPRELLDSVYGATVREAIADHASIRTQVERLAKPDRELIPDVLPTAKALLDRVVHLGGALRALDGDADTSRIAQLDERIAAAEADAVRTGDSAGADRRLALLRKQRTSVEDLVRSRAAMHTQFESAALMLRNLSLDVLKLRSAGIQSVRNDVNSATQEARALVREIGFVLEAADELRELQTAPKGEIR